MEKAAVGQELPQHHLKEDLLQVLTDAIAAIQDKDSTKLTDTSTHLVHCSSIFQDNLSLTVAIIVYALAKMMTRGIPIDYDIVRMLGKVRMLIRRNNLPAVAYELRKIRERITRKDKEFHLYVSDVVNEAKIKKATHIYEHGISLAQTARILGISEWALMKYVGKADLDDTYTDIFGVDRRLTLTRKLFNLS